MWGMSDEIVEEAILNFSLLCDLWLSFSHFAVCLKNDYGKTSILNNEPDERWTDAPLLCHHKEIHHLSMGLLVFGMWCCDLKPLKTKAACSSKTSGTSHHTKKSDIPRDWNPWLHCFENLRNPKIHYLLHATWQSNSIHYKTFCSIKKIWVSTGTNNVFTCEGTKYYCTDNQNVALRWVLANTQSVYVLFLTNLTGFIFRSNWHG
jgi:hypothetical protein